jgi:hypothetical protein
MSGQQAAGLRRVSWRPCVSLRECFFAQRFHEFKPAILNGKHAADVPPGNSTERCGCYRWGCDNQPLLFPDPLRKFVSERPLGKWTDEFRAAEPGTELGRTLLDQLRWNGSLWKIGARLRTGILRAGGLHRRRRLGNCGSYRTTEHCRRKGDSEKLLAHAMSC